MTLRLKSILEGAGIKQGALAGAIGLSRQALNGLINQDYLPRSADRAAVETGITRYLREHAPGPAWAEWSQQEAPRDEAATDGPTETPEEVATQDEEKVMLLRKVNITPQARRHFSIVGDPFADPTSTDQVFLNHDYRYVRESMYQVARNGGFLGVYAESGAGKSTMVEELIDRIQREEKSIVVIRPYVLAMEGDDKQGKTLKAQHIAEAIMSEVAPLAKTKSSPEARFRQMHQALRDSAVAGHAHVLIIDEAHALPLATLRHLKRFRELKDGLRPLLSIVLVGQRELKDKLSEHNPEVREVVQRIELLNLPPLGNDVGEYLSQRFQRVNMPLNKVLADDALTALRAKLTPTRNEGSLLYPLAIHNAVAAAMNRAADLGVPLVTGDVIRGS
ncbi:AAA family ATPase [Pseudoxanthomonas sp. 22568]|uniref:AAA family ATPase n=1 Tax=Pseudoxanthomonas sp. 22568 TaxID=3453945 RepID=UPI003F85D4DE